MSRLLKVTELAGAASYFSASYADAEARLPRLSIAQTRSARAWGMKA